MTMSLVQHLAWLMVAIFFLRVKTCLMATSNPIRDTLPVSGYSHLSQLQPFLPIARATVYKWNREVRFPQPVKLSAPITACHNSDIREWLNSLDHREANV